MSRNSLSRRLAFKYVATCLECFLNDRKLPNPVVIGDKIVFRRIELPDTVTVRIVGKVSDSLKIVVKAVKNRRTGKTSTSISIVSRLEEVEKGICFRKLFETIVGMCRSVELYCYDNVRSVPTDLAGLGRETILQLVENVRSLGLD